MLYPGEYVVGSALFLLTLFVLKRDIEYIKTLGQNVDDPISLEKIESNNMPENEKEQTKF